MLAKLADRFLNTLDRLADIWEASVSVREMELGVAQRPAPSLVACRPDGTAPDNAEGSVPQIAREGKEAPVGQIQDSFLPPDEVEAAPKKPRAKRGSKKKDELPTIDPPTMTAPAVREVDIDECRVKVKEHHTKIGNGPAFMKSVIGISSFKELETWDGEKGDNARLKLVEAIEKALLEVK